MLAPSLWERTLDSGLSSFGAGGLRLCVRSPEGWAGAVLTRAMRGPRVWERVAASYAHAGTFHRTPAQSALQALLSQHWEDKMTESWPGLREHSPTPLPPARSAGTDGVASGTWNGWCCDGVRNGVAGDPQRGGGSICRNVVGQSEGMTVDGGHLWGGASQHTHDRPCRGGSAVSERQQAGGAAGENPRVWRCEVDGAGEEGDHTAAPAQPPCPPLLRRAERKAPGRRAVGAAAGPAHCGLSAASPAASRPLLIRPRSWYPVAVATRGPPARSAGVEGGWLDWLPVGWARMLGSPALLGGPRDDLGGRLAS